MANLSFRQDFTSEHGDMEEVKECLCNLAIETAYPSYAQCLIPDDVKQKNDEILHRLKTNVVAPEVAFQRQGLVTGSRAEGLAMEESWGHPVADWDRLYLYAGPWGVHSQDRGVTQGLVLEKTHCPPAFCRVRGVGDLKQLNRRSGNGHNTGMRTLWRDFLIGVVISPPFSYIIYLIYMVVFDFTQYIVCTISLHHLLFHCKQSLDFCNSIEIFSNSIFAIIFNAGSYCFCVYVYFVLYAFLYCFIFGSLFPLSMILSLPHVMFFSTLKIVYNLPEQTKTTPLEEMLFVSTFNISICGVLYSKVISCLLSLLGASGELFYESIVKCIYNQVGIFDAFKEIIAMICFHFDESFNNWYKDLLYGIGSKANEYNWSAVNISYEKSQCLLSNTYKEPIDLCRDIPQDFNSSPMWCIIFQYDGWTDILIKFSIISIIMAGCVFSFWSANIGLSIINNKRWVAYNNQHYLSSRHVRQIFRDFSVAGLLKGPAQAFFKDDTPHDNVIGLVGSRPSESLTLLQSRVNRGYGFCVFNEKREIDLHKSSDIIKLKCAMSKFTPDESSHYIELQSEHNRSGWPIKEDLLEMQMYPQLLVATGNAMSPYCVIEWRLSWSIPELILSNSLPAHVKQGYIAFKYCMKAELETMSKDKDLIDEGRQKLSSYHFKTLLFWIIETKDVLSKPSPFRIFISLLDELETCLKCKRLPHYFIPDCNLIQNTLDEEIKQGLCSIGLIRNSLLKSILCSPKSPKELYGRARTEVLTDDFTRCLNHPQKKMHWERLQRTLHGVNKYRKKQYILLRHNDSKSFVSSRPDFKPINVSNCFKNKHAL